jgi:hypothetical protein
MTFSFLLDGRPQNAATKFVADFVADFVGRSIFGEMEKIAEFHKKSLKVDVVAGSTHRPAAYLLYLPLLPTITHCRLPCRRPPPPSRQDLVAMIDNDQRDFHLHCSQPSRDLSSITLLIH